ncbi:MAG: hypothetical protein IJ627_01090 [Bacteroidales bacterium]|nr:hypothetical protein [Bacteroidales bacterium]
MKKFIVTLACTLVCLVSFAQGKVVTKKYRIADFTDKITKVVIPGTDLLDNAIKQEVTKCWYASAFEICDLQEFERLKKDDNYYFLIPAGYGGITFLTLVKGAPEATEGTAGMHEVVSIPVCSERVKSGRELVYIGALVEFVQKFTLDAMNSELTAYGMEEWININYARRGKMKTIWISEDDIARGVPAKILSELDEDIHIADEDTVDSHYASGEYNTLVSYVVSPSEPGNGAVCYTMLFESDTHTLYYFNKHKLSGKNGPGFVAADFKRIIKAR